MRYSYYGRLSPRKQAIYRRSDDITGIDLPVNEELRSAVAGLRTALGNENRAAVQDAIDRVSRRACAALGVSAIEVRVKARRPIRQDGEYHGLYEREPGRPAVLTIWMRTARQKRVVTFKTFLRTFVHELCHHLDFERFGLAESFHTQGFFKRESSLYRKLSPPD